MNTILRSPEEISTAFRDSTIISVDLETTGLNPHKDKIAVVSIADENGNIAVIEGLPAPLKLLLREDKMWITHNGTNFDLPFLYANGIPLPYRHYDTLIGEGVLLTSDRNDLKKNLADTMKRRLGRSEKTDADHTLWGKGPLTDEQIEYCVNDVKWLPVLRQTQIHLCNERGLYKALAREQELSLIIAQIVCNGLPFDNDILETLLEKKAKETEDSYEYLGQLFGYGFNVKSPKQVKAGLAKLGFTVDDTSKETLMELREYHDCFQHILNVRQDRQMQSMFKPEWLEEHVHNDRIYANFWQLGARTTRFTSSGPNLQQIPRLMRGIIGGEEGKAVISADYNQIEVWIAAYLADENKLVDALMSEDFHYFMAQQSFGKDEITPLERTQGKGATFTWTFCGGVNGITGMGRKAGVKIDERVAHRMLDGLSKRFPKMVKFHQTLRTQSRKNVITKLNLPWGHQRILMPPVYPTTMMNTLVQGRAAIGYKEGLFKCRDYGLLPYIGGLLHDETIATGVPMGEAEEFDRILQRAMIEGMKEVCDLPVSVSSTVDTHWRKD